LSLSQDFVGARKLIGGKLDIAEDYLIGSKNINSSPTLSDSETLGRSDITSELNKSFIKTVQADRPVIRDDYLTSEVYSENLCPLPLVIPPRPLHERTVLRQHRDHYNYSGDSLWNYNNMKKFVSGYFPKSYISAIRVLAELPRSYYVSVSLEKIGEWLATINRQ
jgi:hypothetical protein